MDERTVMLNELAQGLRPGTDSVAERFGALAEPGHHVA